MSPSRSLLSYAKACCFLIQLNVFAVQSYDQTKVLAVLDQTLNLTREMWPDKKIELMLRRIEQNLVSHRNHTWSLDLKAGLQIFLTKLNLKTALEHPRMKLWRRNDYQPLQKKRLDAIITSADELNVLFRYRVLARIPRLNQTRMLAALFVFTEEPWFRLLPPILSNDTASTTQLVKIIKRKFNRTTFPTAAPQAEYDKDVLLEGKSSTNSLYITQICLAEITRLAVNVTANKSSETIPPVQCQFSKKNAKACKTFVERGFFNMTSGYELFFRLSILTAARLARNCFVFSGAKDRTLVNYLCLVARLEMDRLDPETFQAPPNYYEGDSLTRHDFAILCLMNGFKAFLGDRFTGCGHPDLVQWNPAGCYAKPGLKIPKPSAKPLWTIVRADPEKGCYGRLTASCLAHQSFLIRGLVELGDAPEVKEKPTLPPGVTSTTPAVTLDDY